MLAELIDIAELDEIVLARPGSLMLALAFLTPKVRISFEYRLSFGDAEFRRSLTGSRGN